MDVGGVEQHALLAWLAGQLARPAWRVASDGRVRALNPAAEAVDPKSVSRLAAELVSGSAPDDLRPEYEALELGQSFGGGFVVVGRTEPSFFDRAVAEARELWKISERQAEVLRELCEGYESSEVAERLGISTHTARDHRGALLDKSGCESTAEMLGKLLKMGG